MANHHNKKRDFDSITPTVQPQNHLDNKFAPTTKVQHWVDGWDKLNRWLPHIRDKGETL